MASLDEQTVCGGWENGCVTDKEVCLLFHKLLRTTKEMEASGVIGVDVIETRREVGVSRRLVAKRYVCHLFVC
jgi:hypothetical protein